MNSPDPIAPIETVTVEASRLVDWSKFALIAVIFLSVVKLLDLKR